MKVLSKCFLAKQRHTTGASALPRLTETPRPVLT